MGFRDSNQDLLGFVHLVPARARERILDIAATQKPDGSAYHQYQPLTKRGNDDVGSGFNDDPLWLVSGTAAYVKESGDLGILKETVPFDNDPKDTATLFEHLKRSFHHVLDNLGPHGLPLIGRADWNDCLNLNCFSDTPGESFQTTGEPHRPHRGVGLHRRSLRPRRPRLRRARRGRGLPGRGAGRPRARGADGEDGPRARLGRRVVPARVRLLREEDRLARSARTARSSSSRRATA